MRARRTRLKRRYLRSRKLRESDLDAAARDLLDGWSAVAAKVEALDEHFEEVGLLDDAGELRGPVRFYAVVVNAAARALVRLERHLGTVEPDGDEFERALADFHRERGEGS